LELRFGFDGCDCGAACCCASRCVPGCRSCSWSRCSPGASSRGWVLRCAGPGFQVLCQPRAGS